MGVWCFGEAYQSQHDVYSSKDLDSQLIFLVSTHKSSAVMSLKSFHTWLFVGLPSLNQSESDTFGFNILTARN